MEPFNEGKEQQGSSATPGAGRTTEKGTSGNVHISCPQCGTINLVLPSHMGSTLACAYCGYTFVVFKVVQYIPPPGSLPLQAPVQPQPFAPSQFYQSPQQMPYYQSPGTSYTVSPLSLYQQYPVYAQQPIRQFYSWEMNPYFYQPLRRKKITHPIEFHIMSILIILATVFALVSIGIFASTPTILGFKSNHNLTVFVTDGLVNLTNLQSSPITGAVVTLDNSMTDYTDEAGVCSFSAITDGEHTLIVSKNGFKKSTVKIFLVGSISDKADVTLEKGSGDTNIDLRQFADWNEAYATFWAQAIILSVLSIFMMVCALYTWKRKHWGLSVVGSGLAAFMWILFVSNYLLINMILGIGSVLGIAVFILVIRNRKSYEGYNHL